MKKSLQLELYSFADFLNTPSVSKQAFSQARRKLSPMVFTLLNQKLLDEFYSDNTIKTFQGLRVLAIDGSDLRLPNDVALHDHYGPGPTDTSIPLAKISTMFDVLNNITLHGLIDKYRSSERDMAAEHVKQLVETNNSNQLFEDLLIFDRGYPSLNLLFMLSNAKKHFLMRVSESFLSETNAAIKLGKRDSIITISTLGKNKESIKRINEYLPDLPHDATIRVRFVIFNLGEGKKEYIITSLLDQEKFKYEDISYLYHMRWNIEEDYKFHKNIVEIENFSGKSKIAIEQDFYATIFACNVSALLMLEAQDEIEAETKEKIQFQNITQEENISSKENVSREKKVLKYRYKINRNILVGIIKNEIIDILIGDKDLDKYCEKLKSRIKKNLVAIRPGRKFPRNFKLGRGTIHRRAL